MIYLSASCWDDIIFLCCRWKVCFLVAFWRFLTYPSEMANLEFSFFDFQMLFLWFFSFVSLRTRYGWRLEGAQRNKSSLNSAYIKAIHQTEPLPLTFHYVSPEQKREIHQEFQQMRSSFRPWPRRLTEKGQLEVEYDSQLACFLANEQWRRALSSDRLEAGPLPVSGTCAEASG